MGTALLWREQEEEEKVSDEGLDEDDGLEKMM